MIPFNWAILLLIFCGELYAKGPISVRSNEPITILVDARTLVDLKLEKAYGIAWTVTRLAISQWTSNGMVTRELTDLQNDLSHNTISAETTQSGQHIQVEIKVRERDSNGSAEVENILVKSGRRILVKGSSENMAVASFDRGAIGGNEATELINLLRAAGFPAEQLRRVDRKDGLLIKNGLRVRWSNRDQGYCIEFCGATGQQLEAIDYLKKELGLSAGSTLAMRAESFMLQNQIHLAVPPVPAPSRRGICGWFLSFWSRRS
ncbi:MAG: hypothetical protein HY537_17360 [Deltaproteobacteria bacterium]|nr:hypothetical protein [Deltaproteobacteria bacterium]